MKEKRMNKKLRLNKATVAMLDDPYQMNVRAGWAFTGTCDQAYDYTYGTDCIITARRCKTIDYRCYITYTCVKTQTECNPN